MITENEIIGIFKDYICYMHKQYMEDDVTYGVIKVRDFLEVAKAIMDKIKDRDIDKESEIIRETKIYEEESGLLEEDKI